MALSARPVVSSAVSARRSSVRPVAPRSSVVANASRTLWLPNTTPPKYLDGKLPGDFGFDPLGLGSNPDRLKWFVEGEKTNGRWAMIAVAGILGQELLGVPVKWYEAGQADYNFPVVAQVPIFFLVSGFFETKRYIGFKETGTSGVLNSYPFDPAGLNSTDNAVKEIKNGRLAMVAFIGFSVQAIATKTTPIEGLQKHLADPFGHNITGYLTHLPEVIKGTF